MKIALCGPPHSGKSVLRERLKAELKRSGPDVYPYFLTTNPDGEGAWFQSTYAHDPELATALKRANKRKWSEEHADLYAEWVRNVKLPLTFLDLGGIPDEFNRRICAAATHAILLAPTEEQWGPWRAFSDGCGLVVLAELVSEYAAPADRLEGTGAPFRAWIHHLERGDLVTPRPAVEALAGYILERLARG